MKKTIAMKVLTGLVSLSVSAVGVAGAVLPKTANVKETSEVAVVADENMQAAEADVEIREPVNNYNWQKTTEDEQTFVTAAHADNNQASVAESQTAENKQVADDSQAAANAGQSNTGNTGRSDPELVNAEGESKVEEIKGDEREGEESGGDVEVEVKLSVNEDESKSEETKGDEQEGEEFEGDIEVEAEVELSVNEDESKDEETKGDEQEGEESEGDVEVEAEVELAVNKGDDLPNVTATAECTVSGVIPGTGANKGEKTDEQTGDSGQKGPTYHCNCGFATTDYNELKAHMLQHILNGEKNSYTTV